MDTTNNYYNNNNQKRSQKANKCATYQRQQQQQTSPVTGAVSGTSTSFNQSNENDFKKKYKYNTQFVHNVNNNYNISSKRVNNDLNYNRNRRFNYKQRYFTSNANSYDNQNYNQRYNYKQFNNRYDNYFNFGKYQPNSFQFTPTTAINPFMRLNDTKGLIKTFPYDYAQLPNVVLAKIFTYLPLKDRLNASTACKSWRSGLFNNPCLWTTYDLVIYLCNKQIDLKSAQFKLRNFSKLTKNCVFKFDVDDYSLIEKLASCLDQIKNEVNNLKYLTLKPIYTTTQDALNNSTLSTNDYFNDNNSTYQHEQDKKEKLKLRLFKSIKDLVSNSKCIEHLALGFLNDLGRENLLDIVNELVNKFDTKLKSLHISSVKKASVFFLSKINYNKTLSQSTLTVSSLLEKFNNLQYLSIDYNDLTDDLIRSKLFATTLKKLNLNVNNLNIPNETKNLQRNESWLFAVVKNPYFRITINVLVQEEFVRKYNSILSSNMPLETLRMYFCKSFNPEIIQFLSDNYNETLQSLVVIDSIIEPTLRYHNPLRFDADPDPLILLCWKCKNLRELVVVGYEMLEINLIAIAKLRTNLKKFHVAMDCIIDLKYGKFRNDDFIEDDDGEDTIVDYGFCSDQVIDKVCKILGSQNWHPLEKEELPLSVYDFDVPYEEAYLDTLSKEQYIN